jgi:hypothetical protein
VHQLREQGVGLLECGRHLGWVLNTVSATPAPPTVAHLERAARSPRQPVSASGNPAATGAGETRPRPGFALVGVGAQARPGLQPGERRHVRVVEREVEQRNILPDP